MSVTTSVTRSVNTAVVGFSDTTVTVQVEVIKLVTVLSTVVADPEAVTVTVLSTVVADPEAVTVTVLSIVVPEPGAVTVVVHVEVSVFNH